MLEILFQKPFRYRSQRAGPTCNTCNKLAPQGAGVTAILTVSNDRSYGPGYISRRLKMKHHFPDG